jgi:hypothetical protein
MKETPAQSRTFLAGEAISNYWNLTSLVNMAL